MIRYVLAVDPGKATGMALFSREGDSEPVLVWSGEFQQEEYAKPIREVLTTHPDAEVVCERFTINAQTVRNSQAPYSLEQIGILKQCLIDVGRPADDIHFQSPADAKAMFDNPKLKKLEYWHRGGEGHALDSIRHGLLRLVKTGWKPVRLLQD
jgi:hypothetical protein|tara:strand:- start:10270 stop:10728 length:459 start_codon:yes stop_codon:yes gene_type:complete